MLARSLTIVATALATGSLLAQAKPSKRFDLEERKASHWAWRDLADSAPPHVPSALGQQNAIDGFLQSELAKTGEHMQPSVDRAALLRRVTFDVTGMPPTTEELDAFLRDDRPDAYERAVDRLLASPRFGEHWARHWLDLVRYAETLGHEFDYTVPHAWRYRDYLIRSLNADVPYDRLVHEHIAGDLIEEPRRHPEQGFDESPIGTAFWWFVEQTHSPVDVRKHTAERIANQVDVATKSFLGLTVACAQCHDHKFDAISTADFYAFSGYLRSSRYIQRDIAPPPAPEALTRVRTATHALATAWQDQIQRDARDLSPVEPEPEPQPEPDASAVTFVDFRTDDFTGWFVDGRAFGTAPAPAATFAHGPLGTSIHPAGFASSATTGADAEGLLHSPTFVIEHDFLHFRAAGREARARVVVEGFHVIRNPIYGGLSKFVNDPNPRWYTVDLRMWKGRRAHLVFGDQTPPELADPHRGGGYKPGGHVAVERVLFSDQRAPKNAKPTASLADALLAWQTGKLTEADARRLHAYWADENTQPDASVQEAAAALSAAEKALPRPHYVPSITDGTGEDHPLLIRGGHTNEGDLVPRRFLTAFVGDAPERLQPRDGSGRLQLARAITATPIAARVLVNRLWHHLFGEGLVPTADNFGVLGALPQSPELLDWLALRCIEDGWSIKQSLRRMLVSNAYRAPRDPRRLTGEAIRDAMLAVSGRFDPKMFGPPIATHLTRHMTGRGRPGSGPLDGAGRRSIYLSVRRNFLSPFLLAFDRPIPASTIGCRDVTNVPAQALALLNDPFVHEQAKRWADRITKIDEPTERRIARLYREAFSREPRVEEVARLDSFLTTQAEGYGCKPDDLRVWTDVCHALFNVKEFSYVR